MTFMCPRCNTESGTIECRGRGVFDKTTRKWWGVWEGYRQSNQMGSICGKCWIEIKMQTKKGREEIKQQEESKKNREWAKTFSAIGEALSRRYS